MLLKYLKPEFEKGHAEIVFNEDKKIIGVKLKRIKGKVLPLKYFSEECLEYLKEIAE